MGKNFRTQRVTHDLHFIAISLYQQATQKNWGISNFYLTRPPGSDNCVQSAMPPVSKNLEFLPPLPSTILSLQQKSRSVTSVTLQDLMSVRMDQSGGWSASDTLKSQITVSMKVNSAERTIILRFLLQKLVSLHIIYCLTLIHSCFRKSVGLYSMCADSRYTDTFSSSFDQEQKYEKWSLSMGFYAVMLSKRWGGG